MLNFYLLLRIRLIKCSQLYSSVAYLLLIIFFVFLYYFIILFWICIYY
jgi:hypothetical protein